MLKKTFIKRIEYPISNMANSMVHPKI